MKQLFSYYIEIYCDDDDMSHEIFRSDVFSEIQDLFLKLVALDLPVAIRYETWWTQDDKEE